MRSDTPQFVPGQRWISDAEIDLGLGLVVDSDYRCVRILFPASGETRLYALRGAPLTRVAFVAGDRIRNQLGDELTVTGVEERGGLLLYHCEDLHERPCTVSEGELDDALRINHPQEKLSAGRIDRDQWFTLRFRTWLDGAAQARSPVRGLVGARIGLIPHQLYIASEVSGRDAPRVLLADEVGLGKTIEAGLIVHRMVLGERVRRVLIVVPEPLLHQWLVEMLRRFNLHFALFDEARFDAVAGGNPFHDEQRVLCSLELLTGRPEIARAALAGEWGLLVVDEAHHLHWSETESSLEYDLIDALAQQVRGVLLLTATPEQLGRAGHFGRLRLLDPDRFHDYHAFVAEERHYEPVAAAAARLLDGEPLTPDQLGLLRELLGDAAAAEPAQLIDALIDRHGTGRVLYRNTRAAIKGFPPRRLHDHPLPLPAPYATLAGDDPLMQLTPERLFRAGEGDAWVAFDPRVGWLADRLRALRPAKVLVICAHAATAIALRTELKERHGIPAALFHEGLEIVERDRAAAYFAANDDGAQALICSEIGSEGRNFQFAHHLILFDLPVDPDLLEQRIGRLDRIGQGETVEIHVPRFDRGPVALIYRWYAEALGAFEQPCPAASAVHEEMLPTLVAALAEGADAAGQDALIAAGAARTAELNAELALGRDRLLELHSCRAEVAAGLVEQIEAQDAGREVERFISGIWDAFGVEHEPGPGHSSVLQPGRHMLHDHFPGLPEDGVTVTFRRADALAHEDREFLTFEHPMVRGAAEMVTGGDLGSSAITILKEPRLRAGTLLLELIYVAECVAPRELEIGRFLPPTPVRLLLDATGKDHAAELPHDALRGECLTKRRKIVSALVKSVRGPLTKLFECGESLAADAVIALQHEALAEMERQLGGECERLAALAAVNPNVRATEVEQLVARQALVRHHLGRARLRLDAARLLVAA